MASTYQRDVLAVIVETARKNLGLNQAELGRRLRKGQQAVSKWERGENTPKPHDIPLLAAELGVDQEILFAEAGYFGNVSDDRATVVVHQKTPAGTKAFVVNSWDLEVAEVDPNEVPADPVEWPVTDITAKAVDRRTGGNRAEDATLAALAADSDVPDEVKQAIITLLKPYKGL